jgi:hypothetical protein
MRHLADNPSTVELFLAGLGPGNWGEGSNSLPVVEYSDPPSLLSQYLSM